MAKTESCLLKRESLVLLIEYNFTPGEPEETYCKDGSGYPGSAPEVEIEAIYLDGGEITNILSDVVIESLKTEIYEFRTSI